MKFFPPKKKDEKDEKPKEASPDIRTDKSEEKSSEKQKDKTAKKPDSARKVGLVLQRQAIKQNKMNKQRQPQLL